MLELHGAGAHVTEVGRDTQTFPWAGGDFLGWRLPRHDPTLGPLSSHRQGKPGRGPKSRRPWPPCGARCMGSDFAGLPWLARGGSWGVESKMGGGDKL